MMRSFPGTVRGNGDVLRSLIPARLRSLEEQASGRIGWGLSRLERASSRVRLWVSPVSLRRWRATVLLGADARRQAVVCQTRLAVWASHAFSDLDLSGGNLTCVKVPCQGGRHSMRRAIWSC